MNAAVEALFIARQKSQPMQAVDVARVLAHEGLQGDRYAAHAGTFSKPREEADSGRDVALIAAEAIEAARSEFGIDLGGGQHRRNVVTRGLLMEDPFLHDGLPHATFLVIGEDPIVLRVDRTCPPCKHLERMVPGSFEALKHRGGLRTTVLRSGIIRVGDAIHVRGRREVAELIGDLTNAS